MRMRHSAAGFTLLEAIVTLVVASLIVVVLMQALQQAMDLRTRLLRHERLARMDSLQEHWFRESVGGAIYDLPDAGGQFRGDSDGFSVVSSSPLGRQGPSRIEWTLEPVDGGFALLYADNQWDILPVIEGPLGDAAFSFMDDKGQWQSEWAPRDAEARPDPAATNEAGDAPLPRMVRLEATTSSGAMTWLVPIAADPWPAMVLRPEDIDAGL